MTEITVNELRDRQYEDDLLFGFKKRMGKVAICVGAPRNQMCVYLRFEDLPGTVITNAANLEDLEHLERLLGDAFIDHDHFEDVDEETWEAMGGDSDDG